MTFKYIDILIRIKSPSNDYDFCYEIIQFNYKK